MEEPSKIFYTSLDVTEVIKSPFLYKKYFISLYTYVYFMEIWIFDHMNIYFKYIVNVSSVEFSLV